MKENRLAPALPAMISGEGDEPIIKGRFWYDDISKFTNYC